TGPGKVYLQSLPLSKLAERIMAATPAPVTSTSNSFSFE
ncbi:MAG: TIGR00266 family protein, partial [Oscillatoriales cyanobacterium]